MSFLRDQIRNAARVALFVSATAIFPGSLAAQPLNIRVENLQPADGFWFTPVWAGFHDGGFDVYSVGDPAANFPGLEELAEGGDTGPLSTDFNGVAGRTDTTILSPAGFGGAPIFDPGDVVNEVVNVADPASNRYFSYASMVIPSNDAFVANGDPLAHMVFDASGAFLGPMTIEIRGRDIVDAGTEINDPTKGAAFSALGGTSMDEGGLIGPHPGLSSFVGTDTAAGTTILTDIGADDLVARISISAVPEPTSIMLLLAATALLSVQRRR